MAMSPVQHAVESAVRYFLHNWSCGLQPNLYLETLPNGDLAIDVKVKFPAVQQQPSIVPCMNQLRTNRSGRNSRKRRQKRRQQPDDSSVTFSTSLAESPLPGEDLASHQTKSEIGLSNHSPPLTSSYPSQLVPSEVLTSISDEINGKFPIKFQQSTSTRLPTTQTSLPTTLPQHISLNEIQQIMTQINTNIGSALETEVSRLLGKQT